MCKGWRVKGLGYQRGQDHSQSGSLHSLDLTCMGGDSQVADHVGTPELKIIAENVALSSACNLQNQASR